MRSFLSWRLLLAGAVLAVGAIPALTVVDATRMPVGGAISTAEAISCTRGYSPCIKNKASDVDCYGGSGNGPRYTKPGVVYRVTGSDRYGLDADNDGKGCER
jgi:hypothetical protein